MDSTNSLWHSVFMIKNTMKFSLIVAVSAVFLTACASNPANDEFTEESMAQAEQLAPATEVKASEALLPSADIQLIEAELASVEAQIQAAQARLNQYQIQNNSNPVVQSQMTGLEAEISHYQMIKSDLMARKQGLIQSTIR